jgi:hypothetical protein
MRYDDRIVAFIDILNFRGMITDTIDSGGNENPDKVQKIYDAYEVIQRNWKDNGDDIGISKRVTIFSDSIVISVKSDEKSQIFWTLLEIKHLVMSLIWRGILVRGAVVRGKLIHEQEKVFGPALIEAYILESKAALYPRIILDRELVHAAATSRASHHSASDEIGYVEQLLEADADGMYYIDYFFKAQSELDDPEYDFPSYIEALGNIVRKGLMGSVHPSNADVRVKYSWMRERYNRMVETVKAPLQERDWEVEEPSDLDAFYSQLKKISPSRR